MTPGDESLDPAEAGCQLLLVSPPSLDAAGFARLLDQALAARGIAGFLLRLEQDAAATRHAAAAALQPVCARHGVALLVQDDVDLARAGHADGVQLGDPRGIEAARRMLGPERLLGAACGLSHHAAMEAGEAGADWVAFGSRHGPADPHLLETLRWWQDLFVLPCVAEGARSAEDCALLAGAGADLVAVREPVWRAGGDPSAEIAALRAAIGAI